MILLKVILENFRTHEYFVFEPDVSGVTAISGENGAGKSTIVDAFAWSLFGTRVNGLKNKEYIKEGVDPKHKTCRVRSYIIIGNREYLIERIILNSNGVVNCNVYSRELNSNSDFEIDCGPGISHSENFIRNLLGCDEKGFLSSVFIQQKQVDQIVSAGPRERGAVIEQLIGVSSISQGINLAKDESKGLQKAIQITQPGSISDEEEKVNNQKKIVIDLLTQKQEQMNYYNSIVNELKPLDSLYKLEKEKYEKINLLEHDLALKENNLKNLNERIKSQLDLLSLNKGNKKYSEDILLTTKTELENKIKEKSEINTILNKLSINHSKLSELYSKTINKNTQKKKLEIDNEIKSIEDEIIKLKTTISTSTEKIEFINLYLQELNEGVAICPMCEHPITDPEKELIHHKEELEKHKNLISVSNKNLKSLTEQNNKLLNQILTINKALEIYEAQEENKAEYKKLTNEIEEIKSKLDVLDKVISKLESEYRDLLVLKEQATTITQIKATLEYLKEKSIEENNEISKIKDEISKFNAIPKKEYKELEVKYNKLLTTFNETETYIKQLTRNIEIEKVRGQEYTKSLNACIKAIEEHNKLTKQLNILNMSIKALTDFKNIRVKTSIPMLTSIASDILSKFTGGDFIELKLSEKFEATVVTSSGRERPVSQLSGGELSATAIALRLAIAIFLHEGSQSLLILDEVLVSMSEERAQLILETITSLSQAQIIFIAHSATINAHADKIIEI